MEQEVLVSGGKVCNQKQSGQEGVTEVIFGQRPKER